MQNIYFCICKTICFAQVYVFAYAKVYTLYKTYSFAGGGRCSSPWSVDVDFLSPDFCMKCGGIVANLY